MSALYLYVHDRNWNSHPTNPTLLIPLNFGDDTLDSHRKRDFPSSPFVAILISSPEQTAPIFSRSLLNRFDPHILECDSVIVSKQILSSNSAEISCIAMFPGQDAVHVLGSPNPETDGREDDTSMQEPRKPTGAAEPCWSTADEDVDRFGGGTCWQVVTFLI
jgi:hypothetical protein